VLNCPSSPCHKHPCLNLCFGCLHLVPPAFTSAGTSTQPSQLAGRRSAPPASKQQAPWSVCYMDHMMYNARINCANTSAALHSTLHSLGVKLCMLFTFCRRLEACTMFVLPRPVLHVRAAIKGLAAGCIASTVLPAQSPSQQHRCLISVLCPSCSPPCLSAAAPC
jgi:hypothetical protein